MPKVDAGKEGQTARQAGNFEVTYNSIADAVVPAKEDMPASLRVVFDVEGTDKTVSLFVPLTMAASKRLEGFCPPTESVSEAGLRSHIERTVVTGSITVDVYGSVRSRLAPAGKHRFKLHTLRMYSRKSDGQRRVRFDVKTDDGMHTAWTAPWPDVDHIIGETPDDDWIGPEEEFSPSKFPFRYLISLGLDWKRFADSPECELITCEAMWPGHYDNMGTPITPFFADSDNIAPELVQAVARHGSRHVEMEIEDDPQYGLGPTRGDFSFVKMTPVIVEGQDDAEFQKERERFLMDWGNFASVVLAKDGVEVARGSNWTPDGRTVAVMTLVPIIGAYPHLVTIQKEDGSPKIAVPTPESWTLDGMVCMSFVAERLLAAHAKKEIALDDPITGIVNSTDPSALLGWVADNVPELGEEDAL